ncbi:MAG: ExeM/NucH family extracellular endonuclease, partial [Anaerolineae bacterium]
GVDTDTVADWVFSDAELGSANWPTRGDTCGDGFTPIHAIQGSGLASPLVDTEVVIEGLVVGDFQNNASPDDGDLNGLNVQATAAEVDADPSTSEGIFVFAPGSVDIGVGDRVRVRGTVTEFFGLTEIADVTALLPCTSGNALPTATPLSLPVTSVDAFEAYEGMLVTFPQPLHIAEYFNFDRFGEIVLTSERHLAPTAELEPGADALQAAEEFLRDRITLDDGRLTQNPDPAIHPNGGVFDLTNRFRGGDTVQSVTGVLDFSFGLYRVQPTQGAVYASANPQPAQPDDVGGTLKIASFNALNYFTTLDVSGPICGPLGNLECRGADDPAELTRQRAKIIAALAAMNADVVGLIEVENHPGDGPTADLVGGLNAVLGAGTYAYIATGPIGDDAIRQAFIYEPASVTPVGAYAILDSTVDPRFLDNSNRPALAQSFQDATSGGIFTVAVNHLKSKGASCDAIGDPDTGDGQGNCNLTREAAAEALVDWLATDPTDSGDEDFLIIGDLNSYDKEDPIDAILKGADDTLGTGDDYADLLFQFQGERAYTYLFDGQVGYLDHALASSSLKAEVTGATVWHINADEPDLLDYDTAFKAPAQYAIYAPDAYRSSDHDPVIVGLNVCDESAPTFDAVSVTPPTLWPADHKYRDVTATVVVNDDFDPNPTVTLVSVTSNEPDDGDDDGNTKNDIVIVDDFHFKLRAERSGIGTGRIYTITYLVTDDCGNSTSQSVTVTVPLSGGM